jgi:ATP-dependent Lon protease
MSKKKIENSKNSIKLKNVIAERDVTNLREFIKEKNSYIQEIIRKTIISIKRNKIYEIFSNNDITLSLNILNDLYEKTNEISTKVSEEPTETEKIIENMQKIIDKLSMIICGFGTMNIDDLLFISFGSQYSQIKVPNPIIADKYEIIRKYVYPLGYKIIHWKDNKPALSKTPVLCCNKIIEDIIQIENTNMFECFDVDTNVKLFYQKICGIRVVIQNETLKKTIIVNGIIEDLNIDCLNNKYITARKDYLVSHARTLPTNDQQIMEKIINAITLKDILIFGDLDFHKKIYSVLAEINHIKTNKLDITIKKFLENDLFSQRNMLINLLLYNKEDEMQYICYLLYDLISVNSADNVDTKEQLMIYDSLPWKIKSYFKDIVKCTIKYTNDMVQKYDINKISLEQQIYLLKVDDAIKEKAMTKLKEIKGKSDESGTKAKQYLEGLIKIPFGFYKEEPLLKKMKELNESFIKIMNNSENLMSTAEIIKKDKYTKIEMLKNITKINEMIFTKVLADINKILNQLNNKQLTNVLHYINSVKKNKNEDKITITNKTKTIRIDEINKYLTTIQNDELVIMEIYDLIKTDYPISLTKTITDMKNMRTNIMRIEQNMNDVTDVLNKSIHGHNYAKNQILKIIGQWMNGEQRGYSFGFEGSPGVGKTSLAKYGLANCLKDENGVSRPFAFIALGGSSNGSMLEGHGYTYVNSTWGRITDILMETKCMNPIIYIDELDKVSKTENGKEIIGILTHLIDTTQNDTFQDKYFAGINIDLSKALFIFSYNDPEQIDKILLDRIHRIRFDNLSIDEKLVIVNNYILPEINKKMGFCDVVTINDKLIEHIILNYTIEPGVRKLKELLFDLYGEINIEILKIKNIEEFDMPIVLTEELLETKYLKKYHKIEEKKIHENPEVGIINGLWANSLGRGGIIPIQTMLFPSSTFLELRLTGLQGDVMKESMNVAKSLAWNITPLERKKELLKYFEETKCQGLHIHCPEGAVSKDGPSAGTAITIAIYSLLNEKRIKNDVAITGEINLQGEVTAIGGLEIKIQGGIRAGVKTFLYPKANHKDFKEFLEIYGEKDMVKGIEFEEVSNIKEVFDYVYE